MSQDMVTVGVYSDTFQASMARNALEAAGVATFLQGDLSADLFQVGSAMGVRLLVSSVDENEAHRVLEELEASREQAADDAIAEGEPETNDVESAFSEAPMEQGLLTPEPTEPKEKLSEREENVGRAFRSAILALIFFPVIFLALYYLFLCYGDEEPLKPHVRSRLMLTSFIVLPVVLLVMVGLCFIGILIRLPVLR